MTDPLKLEEDIEARLVSKEAIAEVLQSILTVLRSFLYLENSSGQKEMQWAAGLVEVSLVLSQCLEHEIRGPDSYGIPIIALPAAISSLAVEHDCIEDVSWCVLRGR